LGVTVFDWKSFLQMWVEASQGDDHPVSIEPGASEEQIAELETRIGKRLPPSYRAFLAISNGFNEPGGSIERLRPTEEVDWFAKENQETIDAWLTPEMIELTPDFAHLRTTLQISDEGDSAFMLLNPNVIDEATGEWEAWLFASWIPGESRSPSFQHLMEEQYQTYLYVKDSQKRQARVAGAPKEVKEALGSVADQWQQMANQMTAGMSDMFNMDTLLKMLIPDADKRAQMQSYMDELKTMMDDQNQQMMNWWQKQQSQNTGGFADSSQIFEDAEAKSAKFQKLMEDIRALSQESSTLANIDTSDLPDINAMNDALMQLGMVQGLNMASLQLRGMLNTPSDEKNNDEDADE
jgi:hypothetical protein